MIDFIGARCTRPLRIFQAVNSSLIVDHFISRALDRKMIFDAVARERFPRLLAQKLAFSQLKLVTFCRMGQHWHLLVTLDTAEPNPLQDAPDGAFLDHVWLADSDTEVQKITWQLESFRAGGFEAAAYALRHSECGAVKGRTRRP